MPTLSEFQSALPLLRILLGKGLNMTSYFPNRKGKHILNTEGTSLGYPTGSFCSQLAIQCALTTTFAQFTDVDVKCGAVIDDIHLSGNWGKFYQSFIT